MAQLWLGAGSVSQASLTQLVEQGSYCSCAPKKHGSWRLIIYHQGDPNFLPHGVGRRATL